MQPRISRSILHMQIVINEKARQGVWPSDIPEWETFVRSLKKETRAVAVILRGIDTSPTKMQVEILYRHDCPYMGPDEITTHKKHWGKIISYTSLLR